MLVDSQSAIFELQNFDIELDSVRKRVTDHPLNGEIKLADEELNVASQDLEQLERDNSVLDQTIKRNKGELESLRSSKEATSAKVYDGSVTSQRELESIQKSVEFAAAQIDDLETVQLETMEQQDVLQTKLAQASADVEKLKLAKGQLLKQLEQDTQLAEQELVMLESKRTKLAAQVESAVLQAYDQMRANSIKNPVAKVEGGMCSGCNMALAAVNLDRVKRSDGTSPEVCDECGRMLFS